MYRRLFLKGICILAVVLWGATLFADSLEELGNDVLRSASEKLHADFKDKNTACLTNAGYVAHQGKETWIFYDLFLEKASISLGKGNLLPVHTPANEDLWFAFVQKKAPTKLMMVYVSFEDDSISVSEPVNVYVAKSGSFKPAEAVAGERAFSIVTLANGWADGSPRDLLHGSLFHDHFCCGVATGYFVVKFIEDHLPPTGRQKYTYIGAPAWCQDDYIIRQLNLTPGKSGYYTMQYPWDRPWKTKEKTYDNLGGIVVLFDAEAAKGNAYALRFDWRWDEFKKYIGKPDLALDWKTQPWLHVWYNRFLLKNTERVGDFVSIAKEKTLEGRSDYDRLTQMGANPLKEVLGDDPSWAQNQAERRKEK